MSTGQYTKFPGGSQDKGLNNFEPAIGAEITWSNDTQNMSGGVRRGAGPRYGVAPLAGHSNTETPPTNATNGIQRSEGTTGDGLTHRQAIYGIVPITMAPYDGSYPKANKQFYSYLVGLTYSSDLSLDACLGATLVSSVNKQSSTLVAGLAQSSYRQESPLVRLHKTELLNLPLDATPTAASMQAILKQVPNRWWTPWAQISVAGKRVPYQWMLGDATSVPTVSTAPNSNIWQVQLNNRSGYAPAVNPLVFCGSPSEIITREFTDNNQRLLSVYCLDQYGFAMDLYYTKQITQANTSSVPAYGSGDNYSGLTSSTKFGASTSYADVQAVVLNDPGSFTNTKHEAILMAGESPVAVIYQDWLQATKGMMPRWVDLTRIGFSPREGISSSETFDGGVNASAFFESTAIKSNGADTGFLRIDVSYDIGVSYYNKLIDFETNVFFGGSIKDGVADFYSVSLTNIATQYNNAWEDMPNEYAVPWEYSYDIAYPANGPDPASNKGRGMHINDYELRFYYRESGIGEWIPAGSFDAAQFWFYGRWAASSGSFYDPTICSGAYGSTIGGQPNGFNDYSPLPKQRYICAVVSNQRAFWFSEKDFRFSLQDNIYAYPLRNVVSAQTGKWRGGISFTRLNQSNVQGAIIVFGDRGAYSGWFTGNKFVQNVRISANEVGQFPVDGSDFQLDFLCDATAFSHRSAVVAENVAYWWGPQGVYRYDGYSEPKKISLPLESDDETASIFNYVDMGRDTEVHAVYNRRSHEIVWFYPPKVTDAEFPTYGLVLNTENGKFYPYKFRCQVDASQNITLEKDETPDGVDGERVLLHVRETASSTVQRTFYFDEVVKAGEQGPARELTVISFTSPTTNTRRLNLAAGSVGITAGGIAINDYLCIQNAKGYAPSLTLAPDLIAKIVDVNNASNYIDIELPPGAVFDASATLTGQTAFPVYQKKPDAKGLHGIVYLLDTNYWLPAGLSESWNWQYFHFIFKYLGIPIPRDPFSQEYSPLAQIAFTHQTLRGDAFAGIIDLVNNSRGHCQRYHQLTNVERAANGQAIAFSLSGIHIGNPWTLEYLEAHCLPEKGKTMKEFEV